MTGHAVIESGAMQVHGRSIRPAWDAKSAQSSVLTYTHSHVLANQRICCQDYVTHQPEHFTISLTTELCLCLMSTGIKSNSDSVPDICMFMGGRRKPEAKKKQNTDIEYIQTSVYAQ